MKCPTCGNEQWKRGTTPHVEEVDGRAATLSAVATLKAMVLDHAAGRTTTTDRLQALRKSPHLAKVVRLDLRAAARR